MTRDKKTTERKMLLSSTGLTLTVCILLINSELTLCTVFLDQSSAGQILRSSSYSARRRRANSVLEEILPGNLERECYEESCSQEEAKEIFQTQEKMLEFWFRYTNLNPCQFNPCANGGICTLDRGDFLCLCPPQYRGKICESMVLECRFRNGGCMQYCRDLPSGAGVQCGCAEGFILEPDGQSCASTVSFPCGRQQMHMLYRGRSLLDDYEWDNVTMETDGNITDSWGPKLNLETEVERTTMNSTLKQREEEKATVNATLKQREEERTTVNSTLKQREEERTTVNSTLKQREEERTTVNSTLIPRQRNGTGLVGGEEEDRQLLTRVVGGVLEKPGGSPWQVLIRRSDGYGFCGGTLVSDRWVISAAHCFEESADHVTIGDYDKHRPDPGEQLIKIQRVFVHPHFHAYTFDSDIALVYLAKPVVRGPTAVPACLPDPHLSKYLVKEDNRGVVAGWGLTRFMGKSSRFLRKVGLPVVSYKDCTMSTEQVITDNMFCAGYLDTSMDACSGDSGGPFVVNYRGTWFLTGVVSWGEKCAAKGKYGVYTRLGNFLSWIRDTMERQDLNSTSS